MIQALYQALQISVSWERVSEIQYIKECAYAWLCPLMMAILERQHTLQSTYTMSAKRFAATSAAEVDWHLLCLQVN